MAKNKNNNEGWGSVIMQIGCLILITIVILVVTVFSVVVKCVPIALPIIFLIAFLTNYISWRNTDRIYAKTLKFGLTENEQERLTNLFSDLHFYINKRDNARNAAVNEGIRVNQNGRLSARSYRGQDLQGAIDESTSFIDQNIPEYDALRELPRVRWKRARKHYSKSIGYGIAILVWCGYFFIEANNISNNFSNYISSIGHTAESGFSLIGNMWSDIFNKDSTKKKISDRNESKQEDSTKDKKQTIQKETTPYDDFVTTFWLSSIFMIISYWVVRIIGLIIFIIKYRKPALACPDN